MPRIVQSVYFVTPTGVGRKDYSENVERSVVATQRSHLFRTISSVAADLPGFYTNLVLGYQLYFLVDGILYDYAPSYNTYFMEIDLSVFPQNPVFTQMAEWETYDDYAADSGGPTDPLRTRDFGRTWDYGTVNTKMQTGIKTVPGRLYALLFEVADPLSLDFHINLYVTGIDDEVAA